MKETSQTLSSTSFATIPVSDRGRSDADVRCGTVRHNIFTPMMNRRTLARLLIVGGVVMFPVGFLQVLSEGPQPPDGRISSYPGAEWAMWLTYLFGAALIWEGWRLLRK